MSSESISRETRTYLRFPLSDRIEHWLLVVSFSTLAFTGLAQKFALLSISQWFIGLLGGIEMVRIIHRVAATIMAVETVYHLAVAGYRIFVLRSKLNMLPGVQDLRAVVQGLLYNLGLSQERPLEGRFTFGEKAEYWALIWGTIVMGLTGFILWNPIAAAKLLPGEVIPAAKAAHSAEALLAAAAILVWHFYSVHLKSFNKSMFSGRVTEEELAHEHPLELAELKAGTAVRPVAPEALAARRRIVYSGRCGGITAPGGWYRLFHYSRRYRPGHRSTDGRCRDLCALAANSVSDSRHQRSAGNRGQLEWWDCGALSAALWCLP